MKGRSFQCIHYVNNGATSDISNVQKHLFCYKETVFYCTKSDNQHKNEPGKPGMKVSCLKGQAGAK